MDAVEPPPSPLVVLLGPEIVVPVVVETVVADAGVVDLFVPLYIDVVVIHVLVCGGP